MNKQLLSKAIGNTGEEIARLQLRALGIELVEKVATPVKLKPYYDHIRGAVVPGVFYVEYAEKVSGDVRGVLPGGISVHCEVKVKDEDKIKNSVIKKHQRAWLDNHAAIGGLSLFVWVCFHEVFILRWPIEGFVPGTTLSVERARELQIYEL